VKTTKVLARAFRVCKNIIKNYIYLLINSFQFNVEYIYVYYHFLKKVSKKIYLFMSVTKSSSFCGMLYEL